MLRYLVAAVLASTFFKSCDSSPAKEWRLVNSGQAPTSKRWSIYELDFYPFVNKAGRCGGDPIEVPHEGVSSSGYLTYGGREFLPTYAFEDMIQVGMGWTSQEHSGGLSFWAGGAWIAVALRNPVDVKCVRLYQSGLEFAGTWDFNARRVTLQQRTTSGPATGTWSDVYSWGDQNSEALLPGWTWLTLGVGHDTPIKAYSECRGETIDTFLDCCVWPDLEAQASVEGMSFSQGSGACSAGATVRSGKWCEVRSTHCNSTGKAYCVEGEARLSLPDTSFSCSQEAVKSSQHGGTLVLSDYIGELESEKKTFIQRTKRKHHNFGMTWGGYIAQDWGWHECQEGALVDSLEDCQEVNGLAQRSTEVRTGSWDRSPKGCSVVWMFPGGSHYGLEFNSHVTGNGIPGHAPVCELKDSSLAMIAIVVAAGVVTMSSVGVALFCWHRSRSAKRAGLENTQVVGNVVGSGEENPNQAVVLGQPVRGQPAPPPPPAEAAGPEKESL